MHRLCAGVLLSWLGLASGTAGAEPEGVVSESQIKAAFLYNFTKFIEWPDASFADKNEPITIGVAGNPGLAAALGSIVEGRKVNGHAIEVRNLEAVDDVAALEVLFISASEEAQLASLLEPADERALLTVGESPEFASSGGTITFVQQNGKLRFEINMRSAERAQLKISAELQKLAVAVNRAP